MKKYKTGYTTGVFDLFHVGHLNILCSAKAQCERLIVGVSTDELVEDYKHKRPIIPYEERVQIVRAIRFVDEVVPQTTLDKRAAWHALGGFDVLFHGDDWKGSALYEEIERAMADIGVSLVYLPHTRGTSSTLLAQRLYALPDAPADETEEADR